MDKDEEEVTFVSEENVILIEVEGTTFTSRLLEGDFINYKQIIPPMKLQKEYIEFVKQSDKSKSELNLALNSAVAMYKRVLKDAFASDD